MGVRNADNECLGSTKLYGLRGIIEGYVVEVNGELAEEIPDFVPTPTSIFHCTLAQAVRYCSASQDRVFFLEPYSALSENL